MAPKRQSTSPAGGDTHKRVRKTYTLEEKLEVLDRVERGQRNSVIQAALGMNEATIRCIKRNATKIRESAKAGTPLKGSQSSYSRPVEMQIMEKMLATWIEHQNKTRMPISLALIKAKAMSIYDTIEGEKKPFLASNGWFNNFQKRHSFHNLKMIGEYPAELQKIIEDGEYFPKQVFNIDETGRKSSSNLDISSMTESRTANVYDSRHKKGDPNDTSGLQRIPQIPPTQSDAMESASLCARKSSQDDGTMTASNTVSTPQTNKRLPKKMGSPEPPKKLLKVKTSKKTTSRLETAISKLHEIIEMTNADAEDQYSSFGNHVASQLRELPLTSFIVLQEKIQSLITQERLATIQTPHPSLSPHSYHFVKEEITVEDSFNMKVEV
ncbi:uncharacterized protein LOC143027026 isoform X2 [Oratosquilla oratoria]|uniref:uncharacterized protein LOC143027026 isoform X2 n=1 Tax=Oratosquilla oratoria TaxID=337810 RepID=UPI003F76B340